MGRERGPRVRRAAVTRVLLDEPLRELEVDDGYDHALLVPTLGGEVLGEALVPARKRLTIDAQRGAFQGEIAERFLRRRLEIAFRAAAGREEEGADSRPALTVSVVVCARPGADDGVAACLESLAGLRRQPEEVIVAGAVRAEPSARCIRDESGNPVRTRNRAIAAAGGDVIAFTEDGCAADPGWLNGVDAAFSDSLVMAATGYVGFEALASRAEWAAYRQAAARRKRGTVDGRNVLIRRTAFEELGLFREKRGGHDADFSKRVASAGYRLASAPARLVWDRTPGRASAAAGTRRLLRGGRIPRLESRARPPARARVAGPDYPPLSVAIASYNRRDELAATVEALAGQSYPAERFEAVIVLDGSADGSAERVRGIDVPYPLRLIEQENRGLGASRNRGAREAENELLVFLDDDAVPEPDFLAEHATAHRDAPEESFVLGYTPPVVRDKGLWSISIRNWWEDFFRRRREPGHRWTFMDVADGNSSIRRSLFLELDGFDEGMERRHDWEFGVRLLKRGVPFTHRQEAVAWHHFDMSFAAALRNRRLEGRADIPFATRHPEAKGRLLLADLAGLVGRGMSPRRALSYAHPASSARLARAAVPALSLLEALGLRRAWWRLSNMVLTHAYLLGVTDVMPSMEDFRAFMAPVLEGDGAQTVDVDLDRGRRAVLPEAGAGWLRLVLRLAGAPLAAVVAPEPGRQWDWVSTSERVAEACASAIDREPLEAAEGLAPYRVSDRSVGTSA